MSNGKSAIGWIGLGVMGRNFARTIAEQGLERKSETNLTGLEFKHPVDISALWQQMKCSDRHAGALVE